jgi:O-antigen/teichoic acid export membrane protein
MRWAIRFIGLFSTLILARLLSPDDFGVAAMGMLLVHFLFELSEFGTSMHLIRAKQIDQAHCDTAWTITLLQGVFTAAALAALAIPASLYFKEPRVIDVMYVLAAASLIGGLENVGPVLLRRELAFAKDFRFNVYKKVLVFLTTVSAAIVFRSYWALVLGHLAGTTAGVVLSYLVHPYRPRWSLAYAPEYLRFGMSIIPLRMANTLRGMFSTFLVAGTGSATTLGAYRVANDLASLFTQEIVTPMGRGLLPNYVRLADQPEALSTVYRKILGLVALLCVPVGAGVAAVAQDLTLVLLGPQWGLAADLMAYLAIGAAIYAVSQTMVNQILVAVGRERSAAVLAWVRLIITAPILWIGLELNGVTGVAQAAIIAPLACLPVIYNETRRAVMLPLTALFGLLWRPTLGACIMYLAVKLLHGSYFDWAILRLMHDAAIGAVAFLSSTLLLWALSGRPDSAERIALDLAGRFLKTFRRKLAR